MRVDTSFPLYGNGARAQIKNTLLAGMDHSLTDAKIKQLKANKPEKKWNQTDVAYSIEILDLFKKMEFPKVLYGNELEQLKPDIKTMPFYGITLKIAPTLVFRININGKECFGAGMVHLSKRSHFSVQQSKVVATLLSMFLSNIEIKENAIVDPALCFCIDPFAGTVVNSNSLIKTDMKKVKETCTEIQQNWISLIKAA
jgi:hypothetical protein